MWSRFQKNGKNVMQFQDGVNIADHQGTLGTVSSVTDAAGQQVSYTHDTMGRTIGTGAACGGQTHLSASTYIHDRLVALAHNTTQDTIPAAGTPGDTTVRYSFGFDAQYRPTTVSVGSQTLTTNVYNLTPGSLQYGTLLVRQ